MAKKLRDEDLVLNIIINGNRSKKEMNELERAVTSTNKEVKQLQKTQKDLAAQDKKDTEAYKSVTQAIKDKQAAITTAESRLAQLRKGMKVTELTTSDLKNEIGRLQRLMGASMPNGDNFNAYKAKIEELKARLGEINGTAESTGFNLKEMANKFNHYIGVITAGLVTFLGLITGLKQINQTFAEFDDKVADVQKTTGLAKTEVRELNEEFKKINTRTQQEDLLGLAQVAGKLGIEGKQDILEFVRATDQIGVALTEDLGGDIEQSINEIGKLIEIFNLNDEFGMEQSILKVGSVINDLGASSSANEGYLVEFTKRVAGVAPNAKISIANILGLAATLDQLGQTAEVSGTAFNDIIPSMFTNTATFANVAGMEVKAFTDLLNNDANAALIKVLEGVNGNNASFGEMVAKLNDIGIDGSRATTVLSALAGKVDILKQQQILANESMVAGTSITDEYNIKNNTAAANLDRAKKAVYNMTVELGEKLNPVMTHSTSLFVTMLKVLQVLVTFFLDHYRAIGVVTAALIGYNSVLIISNALTKESAALSVIENALRKTGIFLTTSYRAGILLLSAAKAFLTGNTTRAAIAMGMFNATVAMNPLGLLIAVIAAVAAALYLFTGQVTAAEKAQQSLIDTEAEALKSVVAQKNELEELLKIAQDKTKADNERLAAIKRINEISPQYLGFLNLENINTQKANQSVKDYVESLRDMARVKAASAKLQTIEEQKIDLELKGAETTFWQKTKSAFLGDYRTLQAAYRKANKEEALTALAEEEKALNGYIKRNKAKISVSGSTSKSGPAGPSLSEDQIKSRAKHDLEAKSELEREKAAHTERLKEDGLYFKKKEDMNAADKIALANLEKIHRDNIASINSKASKKSLADQKKDNALALQQAEYRTEVETSQKSKIEQENIAHKDRLKKAGIDELNVKKNQVAAFEALEKMHRANLDKIDAESITKGIEDKQKAYEKELSDLRIANYNELATIDTVAKAKAILKDTLSKSELDKITTLNQAKKALQEKYSNEEQALVEKQGEELLEILKKVMTDGTWGGINLSDSILSEDEKKILTERLQKLAEEVAKAKAGKTGTTDQGAGDEAKKQFSFLGEGSKADILGFTKDDWELLFQHLQAGKLGIGEIVMAVSTLNSIWGQYSQLVANSERKQLQLFEKNTETKKTKLREQLDSGRISQEAYNSEIERLDTELDRKKAENDRNAAVRERNGALMGAIVNTALGVTKASPNLFLMALVGALGAVQIGTILSTPLPELPGKEDGGYLKVSRAQDGKKFNAKNRGMDRGYFKDPSVLVSENGDEFVAAAEAVRNPTIRPVLDIIDSAQKNGTISTLNLERILVSSSMRRTVRGKQDGGYVSGPSNSGNSDNSGNSVTGDAELILQLITINQALLARLNDPIYAQVVLAGRDGLVNKIKEYDTIIKKASIG